MGVQDQAVCQVDEEGPQQVVLQVVQIQNRYPQMQQMVAVQWFSQSLLLDWLQEQKDFKSLVSKIEVKNYLLFAVCWCQWYLLLPSFV